MGLTAADMSLSKARNAARMRNKRALEKGVQPSAVQIVEVLSVNQRKERLAQLIATPMAPEDIKPPHIIQAIDIYNKMDKTYSDFPQGQDNRQYHLYIQSDEAKLRLERLLSGEKPVMRALEEDNLV